ncbi:MAG: hypothetical protein FD150_1344 [Rhodobacteraceae bacterium]|nr:MAG: hypothetical protein FD150_1344 [Paracoccaceae bacterium]
MIALTGPVLGATMRELDGAELRRVVREGDLLGLKQVISSVARQTEGEPVEARAFEADGVFYRIVLKTTDGSLISMIIDAKTGKQVAKGSAVGKQIVAAAESGAKSKGGKGPAASDKAKGKAGGNGNNGGSGNGNSGGNGNGGGNSGGNGNGGGNGGGKN